MWSKQRFLTVVLVVVASFVLSNVGFASDYSNDPRLKEYLRILRESGEDIHSGGELFEVLARDFLYKRYPVSRYEIIGGIEYFNDTRIPIPLDDDLCQTLGELDVVVIERSTGKAVMVGEVKFWRDLSKAIKKAKEQLARFEGHLHAGNIARYRYRPDPSRPFTDDNFIDNDCYQTVGPKNAVSYGFTYEVNLTISEGYWLLEQLEGRVAARRAFQQSCFEQTYED